MSCWGISFSVVVCDLRVPGQLCGPRSAPRIILLESGSEDLGKVTETRDSSSAWGRLLFLRSPGRGPADASTLEVGRGMWGGRSERELKSQARYQRRLLVSNSDFRGEGLVELVSEKAAPAELCRTQSQISDWAEDQVKSGSGGKCISLRVRCGRVPNVCFAIPPRELRGFPREPVHQSEALVEQLVLGTGLAVLPSHDPQPALCEDQ